MTKLIRKTQQPSDYPSNQIHDAYSTSTTDTYSCNYINNLEVYSTTEQRIGTWIDGKPIYRKCINSFAPTETLKWVSLEIIDNVDFVVNISGVLQGNDGRFMPLNHSEPEYEISTTVKNGSVEMKLSSDYWAGDAVCVILEYTKTTG